MIERLESRFLLSDGAVVCAVDPALDPIARCTSLPVRDLLEGSGPHFRYTLHGRKPGIAPVITLGNLVVTGTSGNDRINVTAKAKTVQVRQGKSIYRFARKNVSAIVINGGDGVDRINVTGNIKATVDAGDGNDIVHTGGGGDVLIGGNGNDRIFGQRGKDSISGGAGRDVLFGGAGDDTLDAYDTQADQVAGGAGDDKARVDTGVDTAWNVEGYLEIQSSVSGMAVSAVNSGTLRLAGGAGSVINSETLRLNGGAISVVNSGTLELAGVLPAGSVVNLGSGVFTLNNSPADLVVVNGTQALDLSNDSTVFSGMYTSDASAVNVTLYNALVSGNTSGATLTFNGILDSGWHSGASLGLASASGTLYVRATRLGDLNLDGSVTISDFIDLASNYNTTGNTTWQEGSLNYDRNVTISDFIDLAANFNTSYIQLPGFTTGTYQIINFTGTSGTIINANTGTGAFNYEIVEPSAPQTAPQSAAADPVVLVVEEDPAAPLE